MSDLAIKGGAPVVPAGGVLPWPQVTDDDRAAVLQALDRSVPWHTQLPDILELERGWAEYTGTGYALAANSGTAALHMCVAACEVGAGDEVIVPADSFLASASCVMHSNAIPIFVDTEPDTLLIDPTLIEERITDRTKAIVAVDLNGLPCDYDAIRAVARRHGLLVIEDGSQAHGATYQGRRVGSLGDVAGCSLNGSKPLSALGEGGLFSTDEEHRRNLAARLRMFGEDFNPAAPRTYNAYVMGWNYRIDPLPAAFARSQLTRLDEMTQTRIENGSHLLKRLAGMPGMQVPVVPDGRTHVFFFFPILVRPEDLGLDVPAAAFRRAVNAAMVAEGVPLFQWQPQPIPSQTMFQYLDAYGRGCPWTCGHARDGIRYDVSEYPVASDVCERRLLLGHGGGSFGPPNGIALMEQYADAFEKVFVDHASELADLARAQ